MIAASPLGLPMIPLGFFRADLGGLPFLVTLVSVVDLVSLGGDDKSITSVLRLSVLLYCTIVYLSVFSVYFKNNH